MVQASHTDDITSAAFSKDGRLIITAAKGNAAKLWEIKTNKLLHTFVHDTWVTALAFSPDGNKIITALTNGNVVVWNAKTRKLNHQFTAYTKNDSSQATRSIIFSSDGTQVITVSHDDQVRLWNAYNYQLRRDFQRVPATNFSPDGRFIFTPNPSEQRVIIWNAKTLQPINEVIVTDNFNHALAASPDGSQFLIGGDNRIAELWDVKTKKLIKVFKGHNNWLNNMTFSPDGSQILTGDGDGFVKLWNVKSGALVHTFKVPQSTNKLAYSPQNKYILAVCEEEVSVWSLQTKKQVQKISPNKRPVTAVAFSPNGSKTLLGINGLVKIWNNHTGKFEGILKGYKSEDGVELNSIAVLPDNSGLLTGHQGRSVQLWSLKTRQLMHTFMNDKRGKSIQISPDGSKMLVGSWSSVFELWDLKTKQSIFKDSLKTKYPAWDRTKAVFSPDGSKILTHAFGDRLGMWSVKDQQLLHIFHFSKNNVEMANFSPDGSQILAFSQRDTLKIWDTKTFKLVKQRRPRREIIQTSHVPTTQKDEWLIGTQAGKLIMWDIAQDKTKEFMGRHNGAIYALALSPKENKVLTGSQDGSAKIWDVKNGKLLGTIHANFENENTWLIVTPDGRYDGNQAGMQYLHLVDGKQHTRPIPKNDSRYTKGLLKKIMGR